jgi:hypothetical protein
MAAALVAHSYDNQDPLQQVPAELTRIITVLQGTRCAVEPLPNVDSDTLENRILKLRDQLLLLHFAGHADDLDLQTNLADGSTTYTNMAHFAKIVGFNSPRLRLVFLNGCSTEAQIAVLRQQQVPAVIATTMPLSDKYGFLFAVNFYEKFTDAAKNLTLQEAFDLTYASMESNKNATAVFTDDGSDIHAAQFHPDAVEQVRASLKLKKITKGPVYVLHGEPEVLNQRFADWLETDTAPETVQPATDAPPAELPGVWEHAWLLCDRDREYGQFKTKVAEKQAGNPADPVFLFIHDEDRNCPYELARRYKEVGMRQLWGHALRVEDLEYPAQDEFGAVGDRNKPLLQLSQYYWEKFSKDKGKGFNAVSKRYEFVKFPNDTAVVACHELPNYFWEDSIEDFFEYYLGEFSTLLRQELSERLLVICTLGHPGTDYEAEIAGKYCQMLARLKALYPDRVLEQTGLEPIRTGHVSAWYKSQFKQTLNTQKYPMPPAMAYIDASDLMRKIINDHRAGI